MISVATYRRFGKLRRIALLAVVAGVWSVLPKGVHAQTLTPQLPSIQQEAPTRDDAHDHLRAGDQAYQRGDYPSAELEYRRAAQRTPSYRAYYNLGLSLARQQRSKEAAEAFGQARRYAASDEALAKTNFNRGTANIEAQDLQASVDDYVRALRADPNDLEAKQNLAQVLRQLKIQQQQQQERQQQEQQQQDESEQEENQEASEEQAASEQSEERNSESQSEESDPEEQQQQPGASEDSASEQESGNSQARPSDQQLDREEAERLLELAREQERQTQERLRLGEAEERKPEKDW